MDNNLAIEVKSLTKIYHLYDKPQDRLKEALNFFGKTYHHDFHAMSDVSFNIYKGETVGIIGKNGAGKSTLLKMITGVLTPTSGSIEVYGKISSLLELGAGFHPEMTGLENIYLNGTLMGFQRKEIEAKIDAILAFADIGDFIHQPVKMYSSGMFARLAFSVSINVEPDILIVDEVLSVGDMRFQQKSLRKMKEMQKNGTTILFVSHDMSVVNAFCSKVVWLNDGKVLEEGKTELISKRYISFMSYGIVDVLNEIQENKEERSSLEVSNDVHWSLAEGKECFGEGKAKIIGVLMTDENNEFIDKFTQSEKINFYIKFKTYHDLYDVGLGLVLKDRLGNSIFTLNSYMYDEAISFIEKGSIEIVKFTFDFPYLSEGKYSFSVALSEGTQDTHIQHHWVHDICTIDFLSVSKNNKVAAVLAFMDEEVKIIQESLK